MKLFIKMGKYRLKLIGDVLTPKRKINDLIKD